MLHTTNKLVLYNHGFSITRHSMSPPQTTTQHYHKTYHQMEQEKPNDWWHGHAHVI